MVRAIISEIITGLRKGYYFFHSNNASKTGTCKTYQPIVFRGQGRIFFGQNVTFGTINSPFRHSSYAYIEARPKNASITFGNNVQVNNAFSAVSELKITIKDDVLIGYNCFIVDSNFHDLEKDRRHLTDPEPKEVIIENNVFIGNNVTILKGVSIGENSIISAGAVVTKSFPANVVIGGCPAVLIRHLD